MQALPKSIKLCSTLPPWRPAWAEGRSNNFLLGKVSCSFPIPPSLFPQLASHASSCHCCCCCCCCKASPAAVRSQSCRCAFGMEAPPQTLTGRSSQFAARNAQHATPCPASRASHVANCCNKRERERERERKINEGVALLLFCLPPAR